MIKLIQELVYLFSNKLEKKYLIQLHNGMITDEQDNQAIISKFNALYGENNFIVSFDDLGGKITIDCLYFKK